MYEESISDDNSIKSKLERKATRLTKKWGLPLIHDFLVMWTPNYVISMDYDSDSSIYLIFKPDQHSLFDFRK